MRILPQQLQPTSAVATRLAALAALTAEDHARIDEALCRCTALRPRRDLVVEGEPITGARLLVEGWAFRSHLVPNGHRQIIDFVLPGELIGMCARRDPIGVATTTTLTEVTTCPVPIPDPADGRSGLAQAYAVSAAIGEAHLCRQITRLGRMSAYERVTDWLLELHDRLLLAGLAGADEFAIPLTQELIADALGLTSVHVNRTIRALRESGLATVGAKRVRLHNRDQMQRLVCYTPVQAVA